MIKPHQTDIVYSPASFRVAMLAIIFGTVKVGWQIFHPKDSSLFSTPRICLVR